MTGVELARGPGAGAALGRQRWGAGEQHWEQAVCSMSPSCSSLLAELILALLFAKVPRWEQVMLFFFMTKVPM